MHQTLTCVVINCMTTKGMTNGGIPLCDMMRIKDALLLIDKNNL